MNRDDGLWLRRIRVVAHAADRIHDRIGWDPDGAVGEVRVCLLEGRYDDARPAWTDYRKPKNGQRATGGRFYAWDESFTRCWVIQKDGDVLWIVTVLLEYHERGIAAQRRRLRAGTARAT